MDFGQILLFNLFFVTSFGTYYPFCQVEREVLERNVTDLISGDFNITAINPDNGEQDDPVLITDQSYVIHNTCTLDVFLTFQNILLKHVILSEETYGFECTYTDPGVKTSIPTIELTEDKARKTLHYFLISFSDMDPPLLRRRTKVENLFSTK
ncbi:uncharacterized protein [Antedon mediterranea]|uniref:uncharacterized protein n=1 Tax=Antedon mediterranea TaxID=105859 RepID=UPI003AF44F53